MSSLRSFTTFLLLFFTYSLCARYTFSQDYKNAIGYDRLVAELNSLSTPIPNGSGVRVGMVEAISGGGYSPDASNAQFSGKSLEGLGPTSGHATGVAIQFFGNTQSVAPGITSVRVFEANDFIVNQLGNSSADNPLAMPLNPNVQVLNQSYVGSASSQVASLINAKLDAMVDLYGVTSVVALNNHNQGTLPSFYAPSYNSIVVGRTDGGHSYGLTNGQFENGRSKPDLVAPAGSTSNATPIVSSTAAFLHSTADSLGYTNAHNPEAMKAILMAGADKSPFSTWSQSSTQPLDLIYGAGEVDIYNSYKILSAGEVDGNATPNLSTASLQGWDFGSINSSDPLYWSFEMLDTSTDYDLTLSLNWNISWSIAGGNLDTGTVPDMSLKLFSVSDSNALSLVATSDSPVDNVEHLFLRNLSAGKYVFSISSSLDWDYGIAWSVTAVPEPSSMMLVLVPFVVWPLLRRKTFRCT